MKTILLKVISLAVTAINVATLCGVIYLLAKSELLSLSHFDEMTTPSSGWYYNHPETRLFAFNIHLALMITILPTIVSSVLTFIYLKWKKSSLSLDERQDFESRTALLTSVNIISVISLVSCIIPSIIFYRLIPISILYIVLCAILIKVLPVSKIISKI